MTFIRITPITSLQPEIGLNKITAKKVGINNIKRIIVCYGIEQEEALIKITSNSYNNIIEMDQKIIDYLKIDNSLQYECKILQNKLIIGPVIGILVARRNEKLKKQLSKYQDFIEFNKNLAGLIYIFAADSINFNSAEIIGYRYDLATSSWKEALLPFPGAIYHRRSLSKKNDHISRQLVQVMGDKILNSYKINKYKFWEMLKDHPILSNHLPKTTQEISKNSLDTLLKLYGQVFLKHTKKSQGKGIFLISKNKYNEYCVRKNFKEEVLHMTDLQVIEFLEHHKTNHILQQGINLKTYENRKIDYRVMVIKDSNGSWQCQGIMGWLGEINGITIHTVVETNGKKAKDMLLLQFNYTNEQIVSKITELSKLASTLATELDFQSGPYVDFGFDIGLDIYGNPWIFEANIYQDLKCPLMINDFKMYKNAIKLIINYIKVVSMNY